LNCLSCGADNQRSTGSCVSCGFILHPTPGFDLVGLPGIHAGLRFSITEAGLRIGRIPVQNELVISEPEISRNHAKLWIVDNSVSLSDSSANGTFVNERQVKEAVLKPGDRIRFGLKSTNTFVLQSVSRVTEAEARPRIAAGQSSSDTLFAQAVAVRPANTLIMPQYETDAPRRRFQLILDQYAVRDILIDGPRLEFGRDPALGTVVIDHSSISSRHAEVIVKEMGVVLSDLASKNGTFVNGKRVDEWALQEGDLVQFGACESQLFLYRESGRRPLALHDVELDLPLISVGRDGDNGIHIDHPTVSTHHAEIRRESNGFELLDLGSTNGTFVNGQRITRQMLRRGDRINFGAAQFVFDGERMEQQSDGSQVRISCLSLSVEANDLSTRKTIRLLDDISFVIDPGEFVGLLGPSGAGKSTLMDAMNGSRPAQYGQVLLNSSDLYTEFASLRSAIGYVPQEDILHRQLSVKECLYYAARLRLPDDFTRSEIWDRVNATIKGLELTERADLTIAQLSGGQRKRVSLGIELLSKPALLFADEPTAGQDPRTEMKMMQLFREIANNGSTVVINTHLLSSVSLLDKVAVLVRGKLAYFGPSQDMLPYFNAVRPHEIFDKLQERTPDEWSDKYRQSEFAREYSVVGTHASVAATKTAGDPFKSAKKSRWRQLATLLRRQFSLKFKAISTLAALLLPPVAIAVLMGLLKHGPNEPKMLFMIVVVTLWFGCSSAVREIVDELPVYRRERQRDLKLVSYIGSKLVYLTTVSGAQAGIFILALHFMGALEGHLFKAWFLSWILTLDGALIGLVISAICTTAEKALYVFPLTMIPQLLLAGLLIPTSIITPFTPLLSPTGQVLGVQDFPKTQAMGSRLANFVSPLMVSRWGLEGLSDLYIHDRAQSGALRESYSYELLSTVSISLHPNDSTEARAELDRAEAGDSESGSWTEKSSTFGEYMTILSCFGALFIIVVTVAMLRKERHGSRA
jgi:ABC-type multidrug transport system ATPase subunit/pSer/pThr/pTyr-binding forkhead associated (FHA) protein